ncbi:hypothetical protein SY88_06670 [Clostridiales bacterium PH28_bin88]|nr:hypothetical protein SY88_06670 [Clostridiales bacterium PH28_bin88]
MVPDVAVGLTVLVCSVTDLKERRIYNAVVYPSLLAAVVWGVFSNGWDGLAVTGGGALLGAALLFLPFIAGGMGAGDVKMMAVVGAWKGALFTAEAVLLGALVGGVLAVLAAARARRLVELGRNVLISLVTLLYFQGKLNPFARISENRGCVLTIPYGVALAMGTVLAWFWRW